MKFIKIFVPLWDHFCLCIKISSSSIRTSKQEMLSAENNKVPWVESKIQDGVEVIFYDNIDSMTLVTIKSGEKTENRNGTFLHDEIIGKEFGERVLNLFMS